jgi:hypothetical protein
LSTVGATNDVAARIIKLNISRIEESFTLKPKSTEQCNQVMVDQTRAECYDTR